MNTTNNNQKSDSNTVLSILNTWFIPNQNIDNNEPIHVHAVFRWFEWIIIFALITYYCLNFLDFQTTTILPGSESETFQALDTLLEHSIKEDGIFPLWNPYFQYGVPYLADPMMHAFNPIISIPVLLFGTVIGFKIGLYLSFLAAGFGMWYLAKVLHLNGPSRIWMALLFAFSGPPIARFFQGQYLFTIGFGILPWCIGSLFAAYKYRKPHHIAFAALTNATLFFTGNVYYCFYLLFIFVIFAIVNLFKFKHRKIVLNKNLIIVMVIIGILSVGIISIQFFPLLEFHSWLSKSHLEESQAHTFQQVWLDLTSRVAPRPDAKETLPVEEYYAYIGLSPFIALLALPFSWKNKQRKNIVFFILVSFMFLCMINFPNMPWKESLLSNHAITQFRYPTRLLAFLVLSIITLAGIAIDGLLGIIIKSVKLQDGERFFDKIPGYAIGIVIMFLIFSIINVFSINRYHIHTVPSGQVDNETKIATWLADYDKSLYSVSTGDNKWYKAMLVNRLPHYEMWYHFLDIRQYAWDVSPREIQPVATYRFVDVSLEAPPDAELITTIDYTNIFKMTTGTPFAFKIPYANLRSEDLDRFVQHDEVTEVPNISLKPNKIEIVTGGEYSDSLIVLQTWYPGWKVSVDGESAVLQNISGFIATPMHKGNHQYTFTFTPTGFYFYLTLSIVSTLIMAMLLLSKNQKVNNFYAIRLQHLSNSKLMQVLRKWFSSLKTFLNNQLNNMIQENSVDQKPEPPQAPIPEATPAYIAPVDPSNPVIPVKTQPGKFSIQQIVGLSVILTLILAILKVIENILFRKDTKMELPKK